MKNITDTGIKLPIRLSLKFVWSVTIDHVFELNNVAVFVCIKKNIQREQINVIPPNLILIIYISLVKRFLDTTTILLKCWQIISTHIFTGLCRWFYNQSPVNSAQCIKQTVIIK